MTGNKLAQAASPYLIQHKDNPVNWWQWSPEAIAYARQTGKPILLSIGYAACHWCHVMAHESFEDTPTAGLMNELFVNIKVDREERPDIDQIYMSALHAMGQQGGWPLTMFLTPDAEPYWGGTYFPKTPQYGRPSFQQVLKQMAAAYSDFPDKVRANVTALKTHLASQPEEDTGATPIGPAILNSLAHQLLPHMDSVKGGMTGAPKFPNTPVLEFLWRAADRTGNENYRLAVFTTLQNIQQGGIHDHVGGGFSRYSVDQDWLVPHFEKMLYDNAQLLDLYSLAWSRAKSDQYKQAAEGIVTWLQREMLIDGPSFAASLDADSEGIEGKFYCWTIAELEAVLGQREAKLIADHFGATPTGNWTDPHTHVATNVLNTLHRPQPDNATQDLIAQQTRELLAARSRRIPPGRDDKLLADWNGLMIHALARASTIFGKKPWLSLAADAFHHVIESMSRTQDGLKRLAHSSRNGVQIWPAMASDYVQLTRAALALHQECTLQRRLTDTQFYIDTAEQLTRAALQQHLSDNAHLLTLAAKDAGDVILRPANTADDPVPNPNATMIENLRSLFFLTGDTFYRESMAALVAAITPYVKQNPFAHASTLNAIDSIDTIVEITWINDPDGHFDDAIRQIPYLNRIVKTIHTAAEQREPHVLLCRSQTCSLPINTEQQFNTHYHEITGRT